MTTTTTTFEQDVETLVDYCWDSEATDYEQQDDHDREQHIFVVLQRIAEHLKTANLEEER